MIPYTTHSLAKARELASDGWPPGVVCQVLGWGMPFLERVSRYHQIEFRKVKSAPGPVNRAELEVDPHNRITFRGRSVSLPPVEGRIFSYILNADDGYHSLIKICQQAKVKRRTVRAHLACLRSRLQRVGLVISDRYRIETA